MKPYLCLQTGHHQTRARSLLPIGNPLKPLTSHPKRNEIDLTLSPPVKHTYRANQYTSIPRANIPAAANSNKERRTTSPRKSRRAAYPRCKNSINIVSAGDIYTVVVALLYISTLPTAAKINTYIAVAGYVSLLVMVSRSAASRGKYIRRVRARPVGMRTGDLARVSADA